MSDIDEITTDAAPDDALVHDRRSAWGRLYHGETSIDFHGRRTLAFDLLNGGGGGDSACR